MNIYLFAEGNPGRLLRRDPGSLLFKIH